MPRPRTRSWPLLALPLVAFSCASAPPGAASPRAAPPADIALLDAVAHHGCDFLSDHFITLSDEDGTSSGRAWVQRCDGAREGDDARVRTTILGWQWLDRRASGFEVREYVYFRARVMARVRGHLGVDGVRATVSFQTTESEVTVEEIGRVSARPSTLGSRLVGAAASIFGSGPNSLATSAMRSEVESVLRERLTRGATWSLDEVKGGSSLLDEREGLHAGGALLSGPLRADEAIDLQYEVEGDQDVLARAVCLDEVKGTVESVIAGEPVAVTPPRDTHRLHGRGHWPIAAMRCDWVLVTGAAGDGDVHVHIAITKASPDPQCGVHACLVRLTLEAFDVAPRKGDGEAWDSDDGAPDVLLLLETPGTSTPLGPAFPDTVSAAPWLSSSPFDLPAGGSVTLRAFDLDPLAPTLLEARRSTRETIGVGVVTASQLTGGAHLEIPLRLDEKERGHVRLRVEVVSAP